MEWLLGVGCPLLVLLGLGVAAIRQRGNWFDRLARRHPATFVSDERFGRETYRLEHDGHAVWTNVVSVSEDRSRDVLVELRIPWSGPDFRLEVYPEYELTARHALPGLTTISGEPPEPLAAGIPGRLQPSQHFAVRASDEELAARLLDDAVQKAINAVYHHRTHDLYLSITSGVLLVRKRERGEFNNLADFLQLVSLVVEVRERARAALDMQFDTDQVHQSLEHAHCEVCGEVVSDAPDIVFCQRCGTPHHEECWQYFGACSIYGCGELEYLPDSSPRSPLSFLRPKFVPRAKPRGLSRCLAVAPAVALVMLACAITTSAAQSERPNILIISIDDLNDWTGCLKGHPQARTPNIDRLAKRGTLFRNAHCQAPVCTPSRASLVTGLYPSTTGLYFLQPGLEASKVAMQRPHLLRHFAQAGYKTMGAGKFVHGGNDAKHYQEYGGGMGGFGPLPDKKLSDLEGLRLWDWGPYPEDDSQMPDTKVADWVTERLTQEHDQPFVLVAGFWRPHVPMYAPPRWFEPFPRDDVKLPLVRDDDRDDLSSYAKALTVGLPAPRHEWFVENDAWRDAVRAYLASVAFVDHCVGRVLGSLDESPHHDNTIVILLSDHGWHLGEKQRWAKRSLWNDSTRVPLIIAAPGFKATVASHRPAGLIDIFPTLLELAGLPPRDDLEGRSLVPLLHDPAATWDRPILTTYAPRNHSLRSTRWHYIQYADGSQELYDHKSDPHEWHNVANLPEHATLISEMQKHLPKHDADPVIGEWQRWEIEAWRAAEALSGN